MRLVPLIVLILASLVVVPMVQAADALKLYVAPGGSDSASGRAAARGGADGPFATLERARDEIRKLKQAGALPDRGVTVEVQAGTYELAKPFELTDADSGTAAVRITYRAKAGAVVNLVGGRVLKGFRPVAGEAELSRLDPAARGKVFVVDLKALGITDFGTPSGGWGQSTDNRLDLFFADKPMTIARWPNKGFVHVKGVTEEQPVDVRGTKGSKAPKFFYDPQELGDRPARWQKEKSMWLHGWWFWDWAEGRQPIDSIDTEKHLITMKPPLHPYGYRPGQWWYAYNALSELDQPGEYYVDHESGLLYFWPPAPLAGGTATATVLPNLVTMKKCDHVTLRGFTMEGSRSTGIVMSECTDSRLAGCIIRNCGGYAVSLSGKDNSVVGCDIYQLGDGGVVMNGGDRATLTPARNEVDNCHIHHYSLWNRILRPAVNVNGVGQRVTHNLIDNAPHKAILFGGNDHVIEYNEIHSVVYESNDAGVMYGGYNWTMRGHQIRFSYLHHIYGFMSRGCVGVYLDDMFSSANIYGNLFYKVPRAAFIGGGRDTTITNNVFVDCNPAIHVDARGLGWASGAFDTLVIRLKEMPYQSDLWQGRYPGLLETLEQEPMAPHGNLVTRNICVGGKWDEVEAKARPGVSFVDNLVGEDPHFVDPEHLNFQLRDDSPAFKLGFQRLPLEKMGLYQDPLRATWPVTSEIRPPDVAPAAPAAAAAARGPLPTLKVSPAAGPVTIDADLTEAEWGGPARAITLAQGLDGKPLTPTSTAWVAHDGKSLLIAVDNAVNGDQPLQTADVWGGNDAVEIAVRNVAAGPQAPILILRGYPNGVFHSDDEAGASPEQVKRAAEGVQYKARVVSPGRWVTEWRLPFASLGLDPSKPLKFAFNLTVRKTGGPGWVQWRGTIDKATWQADVAGWAEVSLQ